MSSPQGHCESCQFWEQLREGGVFEDANYDVDDADGGSVGRCRRYPPTGFREPMPIGADAADAAGSARWMITWDEDWCGEFRAREAA